MNFDLCREIQQPVMTKVGISLQLRISVIWSMRMKTEELTQLLPTFYGHLATLVSLAVYHILSLEAAHSISPPCCTAFF
jgi:hypothetical protein